MSTLILNNENNEIVRLKKENEELKEQNSELHKQLAQSQNLIEQLVNQDLRVGRILQEPQNKQYTMVKNFI